MVMKMVMLMNCPCATNGGGDSNCKQNENGDLDWILMILMVTMLQMLIRILMMRIMNMMMKTMTTRGETLKDLK